MKFIEHSYKGIEILSTWRRAFIAWDGLDDNCFRGQLDVSLGEEANQIDVLGVVDVDVGHGEGDEFAGLIYVLFFFQIKWKCSVGESGRALGQYEWVEDVGDGSGGWCGIGSDLRWTDGTGDVFLVDLVQLQKLKFAFNLP